MKRFLGIAALSLFSATFAACTSAPADNVGSTSSKLDSIETTGLLKVSELAAKFGGAPLKDEAASMEFLTLQRLFASGRASALSLGVYELSPLAADAAGRAKELAIEGKPVYRGRFAVVEDGQGRTLRLNVDSGAEFVSDLGLFHAGPGEKQVLPDADYISIAVAYVKGALGAALKGTDTFVYKVRHYKNSEAPEAQSGASESTYQIAVAFDTAIDDIPVIGSGGKIAVHMTPSGKVIGHETTARAVGALRAIIPGSELISPSEALKNVSVLLRRRGVDLSRYRLTRTELGYARLGRDSWQSIVAPHYGFVWEPMEGDPSKKLVEMAPAFTTPSALALLQKDLGAEASRKLDRMKGASELSSRSDAEEAMPLDRR
jgi:hypothetical protein